MDRRTMLAVVLGSALGTALGTLARAGATEPVLYSDGIHDDWPWVDAELRAHRNIYGRNLWLGRPINCNNPLYGRNVIADSTISKLPGYDGPLAVL